MDLLMKIISPKREQELFSRKPVNVDQSHNYKTHGRHMPRKKPLMKQLISQYLVFWDE
jgi:hypothetical protein